MGKSSSIDLRRLTRDYFVRPVRSAVRLAGAAGVAVTLMGPNLAFACATPAEKVAFDVRSLQSRLMVAALTCNARGDYNAFVVKYRPALQRHSQTMQAYFHRRYGPASSRHLNAFVTQSANEASEMSATRRGTFCTETQRIFGVLAEAPSADLEMVTLLETSPSGAVAAERSCSEASMRID